jgi:hypothetical protein
MRLIWTKASQRGQIESKLRWTIIAGIDQERTMEEILREIREMYARKERATNCDPEPEWDAAAFERLRQPRPKRQ